MKKSIMGVIAFVLGLAILIGGSAFAAFMHYCNTVHFDRYDVCPIAVLPKDGTPEENRELERQLLEHARITFPGFQEAFRGSRTFDYARELECCYAEVQNACLDYAAIVARKYNNNADLTFTVENTGKLLTIKFTGTGYPEGGEPEDLSRTYIFDIEGVGADKLPRLVNRAEFIGR